MERQRHDPPDPPDSVEREQHDSSCDAKPPNPAPAPARLHHNAAWAIAGNLFYTLGRVAIISLLAKAWPAHQVGEVIFALSVVTPLSFLINLEIRSVFVTDAGGAIAPGLCLYARLLTNGVMAAALVLLAAIFYWRQDGFAAAMVFLCGLVRMLDTWSDIYLGVMQKHEKMRFWAISQGIKTALVALWVCLMWTYGVSIMLLPVGWAVCTLAVIWLYDRPVAARLAPLTLDRDRTRLRALMRKALPLGIFVTATSLNISVAPLIIKAWLDESQVAYFGAMMMFISGLGAIQNGLNHATLPRLAQYYQNSLRQFWQLTGFVITLTWIAMAGIIAAVWWRGAWILQWVFNEEYARHAQLFLLIIVGGWLIITSMTLGDAVVAAHHYKSRMSAVILGLLINLGLCLWGVPRWGLPAAAWAGIAAPAAVCLYCLTVLILASLKRPPRP